MVLNEWIISIPILLIILLGIFFIPKIGTIEEKAFYPASVKKQDIEEEKKISILVFGDMMLDRDVFLETEKSGDFNHPFLFLESFLKDADFTLANLEGPITDNKSISAWGNKEQRMKFTISLEFVESLTNYFDILGLANNHMQDFGEDGYEQTKEYLAQTGIEFFGDLKNRQENVSKIIEKDEIKIGLVGYHDLYFKNLSLIIEEIKRIKKESDFVIIFPHWGDEYQKESSKSQQEKAKAFIDAGADLVLGGHPHVIQPVEIYNGKVIFYSLGNFIFDQDFSQETMEGLAVKIHLEKKNDEIIDSYELFPHIINEKSQPKLADNETKNRILNELSSFSEAIEDIKNQIKKGLIKID